MNRTRAKLTHFSATPILRGSTNGKAFSHGKFKLSCGVTNMPKVLTKPSKKSSKSSKSSKAVKRVYFLGNGKAEGGAHLKDLLGGKGANLADMTVVPLPVPPGVTINTENCGES